MGAFRLTSSAAVRSFRFRPSLSFTASAWSLTPCAALAALPDTSNLLSTADAARLRLWSTTVNVALTLQARLLLKPGTGSNLRSYGMREELPHLCHSCTALSASISKPCSEQGSSWGPPLPRCSAKGLCLAVEVTAGAISARGGLTRQQPLPGPMRDNPRPRHAAMMP